MAKGEKRISQFPRIGSYLSESGYTIRLLANAEDSGRMENSSYIHTGTIDARTLIRHYAGGSGGDVGEYLLECPAYTGSGNYRTEGGKTRIFVSPNNAQNTDSFFWAYASTYVPDLMDAYFDSLPEYSSAPYVMPDDDAYFFIRDESASDYCWMAAEEYLSRYLQAYVSNNAYYIYEMISQYLD